MLGMELNLADDGILVTQTKFIRQILIKYGMQDATSLSSVTMETPGDDDIPSPEILKTLQCHAGEFNWLSTRTRGDLAYYTSVLASSLSKHAKWSQQLSKKVVKGEYHCTLK